MISFTKEKDSSFMSIILRKFYSANLKILAKFANYFRHLSRN